MRENKTNIAFKFENNYKNLEEGQGYFPVPVFVHRQCLL